MKNLFKPLGIAAAVTAASFGSVNVANAQTVANNALGDLALVPYYTVNGNWITGIHIVNTSDTTQVVKVRFRRAPDSLDALDFNIVMSPRDVYAGFLSDAADGTISWEAEDTTCTVPATTNNKLTMPDIYREDAETGYVEIIAMGAASAETDAIAVAAKHGASGTPLDCVAVRSNFFANGALGGANGVVNLVETRQAASTVTGGPAAADLTFADSGNVLKVSYFIRDNDSGVEFGDNAVHIQDFLTVASMTNQEFGWRSGDLDGFDFPNLNGSGPDTTLPGVVQSDRFDLLRQSTVLGAGELYNEWTANAANGAQLSWVVTMPGQYVLFDTPEYVLKEEDATFVYSVGSGDFRDIPVTATVTPYDREEGEEDPASGNLTVSPALPGAPTQTLLEKETNVITFGGNETLGVSDADVSPSLNQPYGWLRLSVASNAAVTQTACTWDYTQDQDQPGLGPQATETELRALQDCTGPASTGAVPVIGFAAWVRNVAANPDASYGRAVAHSFE